MASLYDIATWWEHAVLYVAASSIASAVAVNFLAHSRRSDSTIARRKTFVATLSMTAFFVVAFGIGHVGVGRLQLPDPSSLAIRLTGCVLLIFGTVLNIAGRLALGKFWSNQIEITNHHELVRSWPFSWCRHPLYGSLVIFGTGMGFVLMNPIVVLATLAVFLPAVRYRASLEERLLSDAFGQEFDEFRRKTPMIIPRLSEPASKVARGMLGVLFLWAALNTYLDVFILGAVIALGLSFMMERDDFRFAWKIKPAVILGCVAIASFYPRYAFVLWLPTAAALMSIGGHCPATLAMKLTATGEEATS